MRINTSTALQCNKLLIHALRNGSTCEASYICTDPSIYYLYASQETSTTYELRLGQMLIKFHERALNTHAAALHAPRVVYSPRHVIMNPRGQNVRRRYITGVVKCAITIH